MLVSRAKELSHCEKIGISSSGNCFGTSAFSLAIVLPLLLPPSPPSLSLSLSLYPMRSGLYTSDARTIEYFLSSKRKADTRTHGISLFALSRERVRFLQKALCIGSGNDKKEARPEQHPLSPGTERANERARALYS